MKRSVYWLQKGERGQALRVVGRHHPEDLADFNDGCWLYRITASDELTWLDLCVRVTPTPGRVPEAHDISLHTKLHRDPKGDRWLDYTSALLGEQYVGHIGELADPHPRFWLELEKAHSDQDFKARAAYAEDMQSGPCVGPDVVEAAWKSGAPLELVSVYRVVGRNDNVVLIEATDMFAAISKYRDHVDRTVAKFAVIGAIKPVYDINMIELLDAVTIIR